MKHPTYPKMSNMFQPILLTLFTIIPNVIPSTYYCGGTSQCSITCPYYNFQSGTWDECDYIDASLATTLTLECGFSESCNDLLIYAKNLIINCNGDVLTCYGIFTVSNPNPSDLFELNCNGGGSCNGLSVYAVDYSSKYVHGIYLLLHRKSMSHISII